MYASEMLDVVSCASILRASGSKYPIDCAVRIGRLTSGGQTCVKTID
jgi:hypothetical protein